MCEEAIQENEKLSGQRESADTDGRMGVEHNQKQVVSRRKMGEKDCESSSSELQAGKFEIEVKEESGVAGSKDADSRGQGGKAQPNLQNVVTERKPQPTAEGVNISTQPAFVDRRPQQIPRALKQASSTSSIAAETPEQKGGILNVKRVSSSNDVDRALKPASAQKHRGRARVPVVGRGAGRGGRVAGTSGRRQSDNNPGRGDGGRSEGGGKIGEHRNSIQMGAIRLPTPRGGRAPPAIQSEADIGETSPMLYHQSSMNSVKQQAMENSKKFIREFRKRI